MAAAKKNEKTESGEYPSGVFIGEGVESTSIDGVEYAVDPETGRVV